MDAQIRAVMSSAVVEEAPSPQVLLMSTATEGSMKPILPNVLRETVSNISRLYPRVTATARARRPFPRMQKLDEVPLDYCLRERPLAQPRTLPR
jgi:hypothetical protein